MDHHTQGRRPHFHRGRRGADRRGNDRRAPQQSQDQGGRPSGDHVDVEQIMRDIRSRIAQRHGIELSTPQIQELAARRLEAILDPRSVNPALLEQLRKGAATPPEVPLPEIPGGYAFEDTTLYESHRGALRLVRRVLNPILKLFFNPNPLIHALHTQAQLNRDAAARESERERRQAEWNALQFDIINRLVTEVSRVSIEMQALSARVESLATRVDYNNRRVRTMETAAAQPRQHHQPRDVPPPRAEAPPSQPPGAAAAEPTGGTPVAGEPPAADGAPRRKRRRRRGRRGGGPGAGDASTLAGAPVPAGAVDLGGPDLDDGDEEEPVAEDVAAPPPAAEPSASTATSAPSAPSAPSEPPEPPEPPEPSVQPAPPPDEPQPAAPVDHSDPGPPDR